MKKVKVKRHKLGLEDVAFGTSTIKQTRSGKEVLVTEINAKNLPFDETRNLEEALNDEKARAFAHFDINNEGYLIATYTQEGIFSINDAGDLVVEFGG